MFRRATESPLPALIIGKRTKEVASLFEINIGSSATYEAILKKANEALVEITLKSQLGEIKQVIVNLTTKQS